MILFHADKRSDNFRSDIFIALTFALLNAHSLGLGATAIDLIPPAIERTPYLKQLFQIPEENEVVASMILGYPKYKYRRAIQRQLKGIKWIFKTLCTASQNIFTNHELSPAKIVELKMYIG
jgi:hypothetical protein